MKQLKQVMFYNNSWFNMSKYIFFNVNFQVDMRAKDPQAWSRPWNFVKGWPTGAVDWSTVKCLSNESLLPWFTNGCKSNWMHLVVHMLRIDYSTKQQFFIVHWIHWTIFQSYYHLISIYIYIYVYIYIYLYIYIYIDTINFNEMLDTKCFLPQVAVLRSWPVVGAPPRRSAPPASGRRRPGGSAARAAPPWRRAAAPRRLRDVFGIFVEMAICSKLFQTVKPTFQSGF